MSSPPIAIRPSTPSASRFSAILSAPPSSLKGLVREEPRIVPPLGQDATHLRDAERPAVPLERAAPAVAIADELVAVLPHPLADDRANHRVQPRAVAASGENAYPHAINLPASRAPPSALGDLALEDGLHVEDRRAVERLEAAHLDPRPVDSRTSTGCSPIGLGRWCDLVRRPRPAAARSRPAGEP